MTIKQCVICQSEFDIKGKAITCSPECHHQLNINRSRLFNEANKDTIKIKKCKRCAKEFEGKIIGGTKLCPECLNDKAWLTQRTKPRKANCKRKKIITSHKTVWYKYTISPNPNYIANKYLSNERLIANAKYECHRCHKILSKDARISHHVILCLDCMALTDIITGTQFNDKVLLKLTKEYIKYEQLTRASRSRVDGAVVGMGHIL